MKKAKLRQAQKLATIPNLYHGAYRKNYLKAIEEKSLRAAVNAMCLECICWQREEVKYCTDYSCPLWPIRPYQVDGQNDVEDDSKE